MWKRIDRPKTMAATRSLVNEFLEMDRLPRERPLSERRLQVYRNVLNRGEFRPVTWASAHCKETGSTYRINGQHTSTLLSECVTVPEFFVTVERYECETMEDVAKLYATFDSSMSSRTAGDIILSFASVIGEFANQNIKKKTYPLVVAAASYAKWGAGMYSIPSAERAETLLDHTDFCIWVDGIIHPTDGEQKRALHLTRSPVVSAMLGTYMKSKSDSDEFWKLTRDETDENREDPTRILARYLVRTCVRHTGPQTKVSGKGAATHREIYVKCIHAWNAWRKEQPTELKYHAASKIPAIQ